MGVTIYYLGKLDCYKFDFAVDIVVIEIDLNAHYENGMAKSVSELNGKRNQSKGNSRSHLMGEEGGREC